MRATLAGPLADCAVLPHTSCGQRERLWVAVRQAAAR